MEYPAQQQQPQVQPQPQAYAVQTVGVGRRCVAIIIDSIIIGAIVGILTAIFGPNRAAVSGSISALIGLLYFIILEATMSATLGKMVMGIHVVQQDGTPYSWKGSIIRNLLRIIDGLFVYLVGAIFVWTSPFKQRLGDKAAHTLVIKNNR